MTADRDDEPPRWHVYGERTVYDSPWVRLVRVDVEPPDGSRFEHHVVRLQRVVMALALRDAGSEVLMLLASFGQAVSSALSEAAPDGEFVSNQSILVMCRLELDGPARPAELATLTGLTSAGTAKLLDRLELAGMITRTHHAIPDDRRGVLVSLTDQGQRTVRDFVAIFKVHLDGADDLVGQLSELLGPKPASARHSLSRGRPETRPASERAHAEPLNE